MKKFAVFGNPISQSKSPVIHKMFAEQCGIDLSYTAIKADLGAFKQATEVFSQGNGQGCNVTVPFKEDAFKLADKISERASLAQAVNTLSFTENGEIHADNTDGEGLVLDLKSNDIALAGQDILLIGAGGAARGVIKPLLDCKPKSLTIVNRTYSKAQTLAEHFQAYGNVVAKQIESLDDSFDLVINSTSASLSDELPPVDKCVFKQGGFAYDMAYGNKPTVFVDWAQENGCQLALDGLGMLVGQAAESFYIWNGQRPDITPVLSYLRKQL